MRSRRGQDSRLLRGGLHRMWFVGTLAVVVLAAANGAAVAAPDDRGQGRPAAPKLTQVPSVKGVHPVAVKHKKFADAAAQPFRADRIGWPAAQSVTVTPSAPARGASTGAAAPAAGTPIAVRATGPGTSGSVKVTTVDHAVAARADLHGTIFTMSAQSARTVAVSVDYRGFAQAEGGNFGTRLHLVSLPACVLTTPTVPACRTQTAVASRNNARASTVTGTVALAGGRNQVLAVSTADAMPASAGASAAAAAAAAADGGGAAGSYQATSLSAAGSWAQAGSSGSFTYSYPIGVPPARTRLAPSLELSYDSASVDGKTSTSQAQAGWAGDGWSTPESYVEQTYESCADSPEGTASPVSTQDQCYAGPVVTLSLNGTSTSLVRDDKTKVWKQQGDTGAVITQEKRAGIGNGTFDEDFWKVVTRDGVTYYFGLNHLPGWVSGKTATESVQSVPVFSAHAGDPCYHQSAATWAGSVCTMGYRWNLDYAVDVRGNAMAYYYQKDKNYYGQNKGATMVAYDRDAYLKRIDYGFVDGQAYGNVPNQVVFSVGPRCFTGTCTSLTAATAPNFPDVPFSLVCVSGAKCSAQSPSFFSTVRLTTIATRQWNTEAATPGYQTVDSYALTQTIPSAKAGDPAAPTLWLSGIARTGSDTRAGGPAGAITLPTVGFTAMALQNRVDTTTVVLPPMYRNRIGSVTTESGEVIGVDYNLVTPCASPVKVTASANTTSCFPVRWTPAGSATVNDWFNRYAVTRVAEYDATGGALAKVTSYAYAGPSWHYDDNEVTKKKYRSYGQFHGYATVTTYVGDLANDPRTKQVTRYYQGMSKNHSDTVVSITDSQGGTHEDVAELQGKPLEQTTYQGEGGGVESSTITSYWVSNASAIRARTDVGDLSARVVAPAMTWTRQRVVSGATPTYRVTATETSYDPSPASDFYGLATATYTHTVPVNDAYDTCDVTGYAPINAAKNLVGLTSTTETDSVACSGYTPGSPATVPASGNALDAPKAVARPRQVKSATRNYYDGATSLTAVPGQGQVTRIEQATDYTAGKFVWARKGDTGYDRYGRLTSSTDGKGLTTTTAYVDDSYGLTTATIVTNPLKQFATTTLDPARGLTRTVTDANKVTATTQYDTLGRLTGAWLRSRATTETPDHSFIYTVSQTGFTSVTSRKMNSTGGFIISTQLYDSLLRVRQTQAPSPAGGRIVADTFYDSRGWASSRNNKWWDSATTPGTKIVNATDLKAAVPDADSYTYDGLGRVVADASLKNGVTISTTRTVYGGDRTTVLPPTGGITQTSITDPLGRTTELRQYTTAPTVTAPANTFTGTFTVAGGTTTKTTYGFDDHGQPSTITDDAGHTWSTEYNLLGQAVSKTDPVAGTSTMTYDDNGNLTQTVDSGDKAVSFAYDDINRKTDQWSTTVADRTDATKTAHWDYDNATLTYGIGHVAKTTTYVGGTGGAAYVTAARGFNVFGSSLGEDITIPAAEGALAGTYTYQHTYLSLSGLPHRDTYPAVGGLPAQTLTHTYSGFLDLPDGLTGLQTDTAHDAYGRVQQSTLDGEGTNLTYVVNDYDDHTDRLTRRRVIGATTIDTHNYAYDLVGNLTSETQSRPGTTDTSETRCYRYDRVQRLAASWTATDACAAEPTTNDHSTVGDPLDATAAYWTSWSYDTIGRRTSQVEHATTSSAPQATTAYGYTSAAQPLTLTAATTTTVTPNESGTLTTTEATGYGYDTNGNLTTRTGAGYGDQSLDWDNTGQLTKVTSTTNGVSTYTYDAGGQLLSQHNPGTSTLYLPDGQLTLNTASNTVSGVRYYALPGGDTAHRTGTGTAYGFDIADNHGSVGLTLDNTAQNPTWRAFTPFGDTRGTAPTWYDNRTFLNKPNDTTTGFVNVGARYYDPTIGAFISPDPLLNPADPQALSGYAYAANNPVTFSDPNGLMPMREESGTQSPCNDACQATATGTVNQGKTNSNNNNDNDSTAQPKKKKAWYERGADWVSDNKNQIIGGGVGVLAYVGCTALTGGAGALGCLAVGGAAGKLTTDALNGDIHNATDVVESAITGAAEGVLAVPLAAVDLVGQGKAIAADIKEGDVAGALGHGALAGLDALTIVGAGKAMKTRGCNSFVPGTLVLMADGTRKAIEDINLGDNVLADDPDTGVQGPRPVTTLIQGHGTKTLVKLTLDSNGDHKADGHITATDGHPIWDADTHTWTRADTLHRGDHLITPDGARVTVLAVLAYGATATVHNLTINDLHTYYVLAGNTPVLVHNSSCSTGKLSDPLPRGMNNKIASAYDDAKAGQLTSHDTYSGREHPWWAGSNEYRVPGRPETDRILEKELPGGAKVYGWTSTHYQKIQRFSAPHFPDAGWN